MKLVRASELLAGSDHEFLVTLYTTVLNRWPDEEGYRHYLKRIEGKPDQRLSTIEEVATSDEARRLGIKLDTAGASQAAAAVARAPAAAAATIVPRAAEGDLRAEVAALRMRLDRLAADLAALKTGGGATPEQAEAVTATLEQTRAALEELRLYTQVAMKRYLTEYVNELLGLQAQQFENRIRLLEQRLP
jgi:hypothetical protein